MIKFLLGLVKVKAATAKSRTFSVGLVAILGGIAGLVSCYTIGDWSQAATYIAGILGGFAAITGRDAINKIAEAVKK